MFLFVSLFCFLRSRVCVFCCYCFVLFSFLFCSMAITNVALGTKPPFCLYPLVATPLIYSCDRRSGELQLMPREKRVRWQNLAIIFWRVWTARGKYSLAKNLSCRFDFWAWENKKKKKKAETIVALFLLFIYCFCLHWAVKNTPFISETLKQNYKSQFIWQTVKAKI